MDRKAKGVMMKKIICLLLAIVTVFVFVSCGEPCAVHVDDNGDGKCDVCELDYVSPENVIFNMVAASNPTTVKTVTEASFDGVSYVGVYDTVIYEDGSFKYSFTQQRPVHINEDIEEPYVTEEGIVEYENGIYSLNGEAVSGAPDVAYLNIKAAITKENISEYKVDSTGRELTATISAAACKTIFGINVNAENVSLTVKTNGVRLHQIILSYEDASGVVVTAQTSFAYTPVSSEA